MARASMRLRLYENHRFVLYAPFYAAHAIGADAAEKLAIELLPSPDVGLAEQALLDGMVEVLWAGPMRVMRHHDENPNSARVCFAEVVCRDPFSIVGQYPNPVSGSPTLPKCALPPSARCRRVVMPAGGSAAGGCRSGAARSHRRSLYGRKHRCLERGPDRSSAAFRARRRRSLGFGEGSPVVRNEHPWPYRSHGFRHDPGQACPRRRTVIAYGQSDPADAAVDP